MIKTATVFANQASVEVFPSSHYDRYIVYEMLFLFWAGIIGLIVIIRMKLKEIERVQGMGLMSGDNVRDGRSSSRGKHDRADMTALPSEDAPLSRENERKTIPLLD